MNTLWQDLRYGARMLLKSPSISIVVILALALGIGANTAIFSVINSVLLRPLPYDQADRLLFLNERSRVMDEMSISYPNFTDWRNQNHVFEKIGVYNRGSYNLTGSGEAGRDDGASAGRYGQHRRESRKAISQFECRRSRAHSTHAGSVRRRCPFDPLGVIRRRRVRATDCVREYRESFAGPSHRASKRD